MFSCCNCYQIISTRQKIGFHFTNNVNYTCQVCDDCYYNIDSKLKPLIDTSKLRLLKQKISRIRNSGLTC